MAYIKLTKIPDVRLFIGIDEAKESVLFLECVDQSLKVMLKSFINISKGVFLPLVFLSAKTYISLARFTVIILLRFADGCRWVTFDVLPSGNRTLERRSFDCLWCQQRNDVAVASLECLVPSALFIYFCNQNKFINDCQENFITY